MSVTRIVPNPHAFQSPPSPASAPGKRKHRKRGLVGTSTWKGTGLAIAIELHISRRWCWLDVPSQCRALDHLLAHAPHVGNLWHLQRNARHAVHWIALGLGIFDREVSQFLTNGLLKFRQAAGDLLFDGAFSVAESFLDAGLDRLLDLNDDFM